MTDTASLQAVIDAAWDDRASVTLDTKGEIRDAVNEALSLLDAGAVRVAEPHKSGNLTEWRVNQWLKKAVLLSFRLNDNGLIEGANGPWWDKVATKFEGWTKDDFKKGGFRVVPPATVRRGSFIAKNAVLMPSYVNIGAYVDEGAMIDTWATVGSCAQIGKNCHISGGAGIGGVLEPLQANPVVIEDNCFIGARAEVAEGVIVREGSVLSMGVYLGASTKIVNRETGAVTYGEVPPYSVVVSGSMPSPKGGPSLYCAVIVKQVDEKTRSKTSVNELLRD
ncbi:2,3,4,5-tetrahydropyridine-2,6-dicarboxylate N-succinyltransferase [Hyphococcus sp.]|jgi:2,3,4,5-tetrahydropyridine-2-carboxylate N-succinyltransferase|uniref:2,3,4,5-tetrahydropyridine-2,6-dicarboxylate N-succinyltransferase n=1 Tax=Hyphococcus sp. TaxID=2038636 RepID=UPI003D1374DA